MGKRGCEIKPTNKHYLFFINKWINYKICSSFCKKEKKNFFYLYVPKYLQYRLQLGLFIYSANNINCVLIHFNVLNVITGRVPYACIHVGASFICWLVLAHWPVTSRQGFSDSLRSWHKQAPLGVNLIFSDKELMPSFTQLISLQPCCLWHFPVW